MNFLKAQNIHVIWKSRLEKYLQDPEGQHHEFDKDVAGDKSQCEFGSWINEKRELLSQSEHFVSVEALHDEFHQLVADVIRYVDEENQEEATKILKGRYEEISHQLKIMLSKLAKDFDYQI